ncbi:hypothetical protein MRB53_039291 [Persea americana]|nr:hypothetical protein MRB53_039291 [Persea americana]
MVDAIATAHTPPHHYDPVRGYAVEAHGAPATFNQSSSRDVQGPVEDEAEDQDEDDDFGISDEDDEVDDEVDDEIIESANPNDYTKSYNRQRRLNDPSVPASQQPKTNSQRPKANTAALVDDQITSLSRHAAKLKLDHVQAGVGDKGERTGDRADRATSEQVLDPRTRMILLQMINRGIVSEINGCISTGKEANVYHATSVVEGEAEIASTVLQRAIKVYKTSILVFKDRDKYVTGEFRFRQGYNKSSNRAIVKVWAEKEMRNLKRIHNAGIPSPEPLQLRSNVLVMSFLGDKKGWSAPRLRDVQFEDSISTARWHAVYCQVVGYMRIMYQACKLVHADLSEYNILYFAEKAWIIDVSQSVEHDHPRSLDFLRMDVKNVTAFFARKEVETLSEMACFEFVVAEKGTIDMTEMAASIEQLSHQDTAAGVPINGDGHNAEVDTAVFRAQYIPQNLEQVYDVERDAKVIQEGKGDELVYRSLLAKSDSAMAGAGRTSPERSAASSDSESEDSASDGDFEEDDQRPRGKRFEDKDSKKEHKKLVKEEKREKRKNKMPKHLKKQLVNGASRRK